MRMIVTAGEILVEIMAVNVGQDFRSAGPLVGPFPSGAPAIFIDQVGRLGQPCGMIGSVGDDDFGRLNLARLAASGVDVSAIHVHAGATTGSAFVRYEASGQRHFVFNIRDSASGRIALDAAAEALLARADHIHVMGSSLFSAQVVAVVAAAVDRVKARGGTMSFDPNLRKELLGDAGLRDASAALLRRCDLFLPSGDELTLLTGAQDKAGAVAEILAGGVRAVVLKGGAHGARYCDAHGTIDAAAYAVEEVDPTGAGDCFGATFVTCWLRGMSPERALAYANAGGARAVTRKGPMEGASTFAELDAFMAGR